MWTEIVVLFSVYLSFGNGVSHTIVHNDILIENNRALPALQVLETLTAYKDLLTFSSIWTLYNNASRRNRNEAIEISPECHQHLTAAAASHFKEEVWPIQMIDAWGKFPEGILSGHFGMMGDFQECLLLSGSVTDIQNTTQSFNGRYCPMHLQIYLPSNDEQQKNRNRISKIPTSFTDDPLYPTYQELNLLLTQPTLGVCLPSSCSRDDFNAIFSSLTTATNGVLQPITSYCQTTEKPAFDATVIGMIVVLIILFLVTLVGTIVDIMYLRKPAAFKPSLRIKILRAFSFPRNFSKLLNTATFEDNLGCLHGLRFLSICWVVLGHTWSIMTYSSVWNILRISGFHESWISLTIANATFCVDTFFTLGGFLIAYQMLHRLQKTDGLFNPFLMYLHRFIRLTPTYAFLIGIIATFQPYFSTGPMWGLIEMNSKYCRRNWWENLLYVNNLLSHNTLEDPYDVPCFGEAWYLGCDMQLFLVSIWVVYLLWRQRALGLFLLTSLTIASVLTPAVIIAKENLLPTSIPLRPFQLRRAESEEKEVKNPSGQETGNYDLDVYVKPWARSGPYLAGIWTAYFYHLKTTKRFKLPKFVVKVGWLISTATALSLLYGPIEFFNVDKPIPKVEGIIYGGLSRFSWGVSIGWIIYACVTDNGGMVNKILSLKIFMPLGRMSFCVFLLSYELQQMFHARYPHPLSYDIYFLVNMFAAHLTMSLFVGFWMTILLESPFIQLGKVLIKRAQ